MSNRLAELEQRIKRREKGAPNSPEDQSRQGRPQGAMTNARQSTPNSGGLSARVSRWPRRGDSHGMGLPAAGTLSAISYDIPGNFWVLAQPSGMTCWATVFTMLKSWRTQQEMSIPEALQTVGQRWVDLYNANRGLAGADKPDFISSAGLAAQPPQSFSIEGWEQLLRNFGPIWITTDEDLENRGGIHARIITGIHGDGTPTGTRFKIVDPSRGRRYEEAITAFFPKYEGEEAIGSRYTRIQVVHWQSDGRSEQQAVSVGRAHGVRSRPMDIATAEQAQRQSRGTGTLDVRYNVQLVPQQTGMSCWAAGFAMIVGWREQMSLDPSEIARATGYWAQYRDGLLPEDTHVMDIWGLVPEAPQSYTVSGFSELLRNFGPLWVATAEPGAHIRVVTGIHGDGSPDGTTLHINDPWEQGMNAFQPDNRGSQYTETYRQFVQKQARLADREMDIDAPIYVSHLPRLPDWMNSSSAKSFSYFMGRPIAMEAPSNPENFRLLTSGTWNGNTSMTVRGGQAMWFKIRNTNVLGTTISISDHAGQNKQSIILPLGTTEFVFSIFGTEPMGWRFDISTNSDAFMVTWELWSTWVEGMPPNR